MLMRSPYTNQYARTQRWPQGATLAEKLWGSKQDLMKTIDFISDTHIYKSEAEILGTQKKKKKKIQSSLQC